jgi:hypothetical protein
LATENALQKLPVIATAIEAIKLPLIHWREFFRFGCITLGVSFLPTLFTSAMTPAAVYSNGTTRHINPIFSIISAVFALTLIVVAVPFQVAWIRLIINGAASVANRPIWTFKRTEWLFLLATFLIAFLIFGIAATPSIAAIFLSRNWFEATLAVLTLIIMLAAAFMVAVRLAFVYVELALQRYKSLRHCWNQTRSYFWRLIGLVLSLTLLFIIGGAILVAVDVTLVTYAGKVTFGLLGSILGAVERAAFAGAIALAYKFTAPEPQVTALASTS